MHLIWRCDKGGVKDVCVGVIGEVCACMCGGVVREIHCIYGGVHVRVCVGGFTCALA